MTANASCRVGHENHRPQRQHGVAARERRERRRHDVDARAIGSSGRRRTGEDEHVMRRRYGRKKIDAELRDEATATHDV